MRYDRRVKPAIVMGAVYLYRLAEQGMNKFRSPITMAVRKVSW